MASNGRRMLSLSTNMTAETIRDIGKRMDADMAHIIKTISATMSIRRARTAMDLVHLQDSLETMDMRNGKVRASMSNKEAMRNHITSKATALLDRPDGVITIKANHPPTANISMTSGTVPMDKTGHPYRGKVELPIRLSSIARAHWRPSRMAQTTSD